MKKREPERMRKLMLAHIVGVEELVARMQGVWERRLVLDSELESPIAFPGARRAATAALDSQKKRKTFVNWPGASRCACARANGARRRRRASQTTAWSAALIELDAHSVGNRQVFAAEVGKKRGRAPGASAHWMRWASRLCRRAATARAPSSASGVASGRRGLDPASADGQVHASDAGQRPDDVPSTVKRGAPGAHLDVPLHGLDDGWDFSLIGAVEVIVPGAPASDEIALVVALGVGPRNELAA